MLLLLGVLPLLVAAVGGELVIVDRQGWAARAPQGAKQTLTAPVKYVILHHTSTPSCSTQKKCAAQVRAIQDDHMDTSAFHDIGYNFLVGGDGLVYEGRGWDTRGAFLKGWNVKAVGIALIGDFNHKAPSDAQLQVAQLLIAQGVKLGKLSGDHLLAGACQVGATRSPGQLTVNKIRSWPDWWSYSIKGASCK